MAAADPSPEEKSVFEQLRAADHEEIKRREQAINDRIHATYQQSQKRLAHLIAENSTLATTVSSVTVLGAPNTRHSFLKRIVDPLLSANRDRPFTQSELVREASIAASTLGRFDIFQAPVSVYIDKAEKSDPTTTPTDVAVYFSVKEKSKVKLQTGTDVGNAEGSAYANLSWRNLFGGAETLDVNASLGTRTRSSYQAYLETPFLSNPEARIQVGGLQSTTQKVFASHEEVVRGGWTKFRYLTTSGSMHEFGYNGFWRQVTGLAQTASPTVRNDAGDSFKSSLSHTWLNDQRDNPMLPSSGYMTKTTNEIAGVGPLAGDVAFFKSELETQQALSIPVPGIQGNSGVSLTTGFRAGLLYPLTLNGASNPSLTRINDRFQLGGPTDVRGFRLSGLGPHDGPDAVGGDVYAAGSANLLVPLPRLGADKPLRLQAFLNGGRLLALSSKGKEGSLSSDEVASSMKETMAELGNGLPSMSAGIGLVYAHPAARFELNFSLPLVLRRGEEGRKGLQFGIGINFM